MDNKTVPSSYDVIGSIAILPLKTKNASKAAKTLLSEHKNIKTVLLKAGKVKGRLRKHTLKFIAGAKTLETMHKENDCMIKVNVKDCYFSPRLSNERIEIAKKVKNNETILVMFAGVAPYALVIAKNSKAKKVYSVELNKKASEYARQNVLLNKLENVEVVQGDVKRAVKKFSKSRIIFDRIVMPRPQLKETFLDEALSVAKKKCAIHFYDFLSEDEIPGKAISKIQTACHRAKRKFKVIGWKIAGKIAPYRCRVRIDFIAL